MPLTTPIAEADRLGWPTLSVQDSRQVDQTAMEDHGVAGITLMNNAGQACAERLLAMPLKSHAALILCGGGNNGGDGFVIARLLCTAGVHARVILLVSPERLRGDAKMSYERAIDYGVEIQSITDVTEVALAVQASEGLIVDCMLGTGATGDPRDPFATAIRTANHITKRGKREGVAIDIPSGLDGDTGIACSPTFRADLTLTFVTAKTGMRNPGAADYLGEIEIVDIGLPAAMMQTLRPA